MAIKNAIRNFRSELSTGMVWGVTLGALNGTNARTRIVSRVVLALALWVRPS
jgi:hypothetical protein